MKCTVNWIASHIPGFVTPPAVLADQLTMLGLEVDMVQALDSGMEHVVAARILGMEAIAGDAGLYLCRVDAGQEEISVVTGATNIREGSCCALALPGAVIGDNVIVSMGVFCSERDLGLGDAHDGVVVLDEETTPGTPVADALALRDHVIEVDLTPNRADCASVVGIAREAAAAAGLVLKAPEKIILPADPAAAAAFSVVIEDAVDCPRYTARLLRNIRIGPSPWWLRRALITAGVRPIDCVVDVTNFIMLELGQPLHAFDFSCIKGSKLVVRRGAVDEKIVALDGVSRDAGPEVLFICDTVRPVAVAGVMGGRDSGITAASTDILLESACFDPVIVRRGARQLNMHSESSYRFERGVDPEGCLYALDRAAALILQLAGGEADGGCVDLYPGRKDRRAISLRRRRVCDLLGVKMDTARMTGLLQSIGIDAVAVDSEMIAATIPGFRIDLEREIDLVEEIARLAGYNEIPSSLPAVALEHSCISPMARLTKQLSAFMVGMDFFEAVNYSFGWEKNLERLGLAASDPLRCPVRLANPLSEEQAVLRTTLLPGLLENLRRNCSHMRADVRLFEIGKVFFVQALDLKLPAEPMRLGAVLAGRRFPDAPLLHAGEGAVDILDVRGVVETLIAGLRLDDQVRLAPPGSHPAPYWRPGHVLECLTVSGEVLGFLGALDSGCLKEFDIKGDVYYLELRLDCLTALSPRAKQMRPLPRYPSMRRDIALLLPEDQAAGAMPAAVEAMDALVAHCELFDIYRGRQIDKGMKSVALAVTYRLPTSTLDDATVDRVHRRIIEQLVSQFNGRLREES